MRKFAIAGSALSRKAAPMSRTEIFDERIELAGFGYTVRVGDGLLASCGGRVREFTRAQKAALVTDATVGSIYGREVRESLESAGFEVTPIEVPAGEASKSLEQAGCVIDRMVEGGLDRSSVLVALGGGVVGDLAGLVAALYYRGIPFVQIPTTVVAQVDSSVGGKTGVNAPGGKNLIGAFHHPLGVIADPLVLQSLPLREFNEGVAEMIKHAVIRDAEMLNLLDPSQRRGLAGIIARNVAIKARIVEADEKERSGERALLNFGHTIGHAVEQAAGYGALLHGEAVSIGMHAALSLSVQKAGLPESERDRVVAVLDAFQLPSQIPPGLRPETILSAMERDKKFVGGSMRFVLTERLGTAFVSDEVTRGEVERVIVGLGAG